MSIGQKFFAISMHAILGFASTSSFICCWKLRVVIKLETLYDTTRSKCNENLCHDIAKWWDFTDTSAEVLTSAVAVCVLLKLHYSHQKCIQQIKTWLTSTYHDQPISVSLGMCLDVNMWTPCSTWYFSNDMNVNSWESRVHCCDSLQSILTLLHFQCA